MMPAQRPPQAAKALTGDRLMRYKAGQQSGAAVDAISDDVPDLAAGPTEQKPGAVSEGLPALATPQRGYCVSNRCLHGVACFCTIVASAHTGQPWHGMSPDPRSTVKVDSSSN